MNQGRLQIRHLEAFRAVIQGGSVSEAARILGLSQPAVSKIIVQAEALIGKSLFDRRLGRLIPTALAITLYNETGVLFSTIENIDNIVSRVINDEAQPISLGSFYLLATTLLPGVLAQWHANTGRALYLHCFDLPDLINLLLVRQLDMAITMGEPKAPGVESVRIMKSPLYCALPIGHELAEKNVVCASDLDGKAYIAFSRSEGVQTIIDRVFSLENVKPNEVMQVPLAAAAVRLVEKGAGIALVDACGLQEARQSNLIFRRFVPEIYFEYYFVWPEMLELDTHCASLVNMLMESSTKMLEDAENQVNSRAVSAF